MNMKKMTVAVLGFGAILLAPLALARLQPDPESDSPDSPDRHSDHHDHDRKSLVRRALAQGSLEVDTGWLAVKKSEDPRVVEFGRKMANSHDASNRQLSVIADKLGITSSSRLDKERAEKVGKLRKAGSRSFDDIFLKGQIESHEEMASLFSSVSHDDNKELAAFAAERLDMINGHLREARDLRERLA